LRGSNAHHEYQTGQSQHDSFHLFFLQGIEMDALLWNADVY
jgi:hypothetical protein